MSTESTSFVNTEATYGSTLFSESTASDLPFSLKKESSIIIQWAREAFSTIRTTRLTDHPIPFEPDAELAILLYTSYIIRQPSISKTSIRLTLTNSAIVDRIQCYLNDAIEDIFDTGGIRITDVSAGDEDHEGVEKMMWRTWPIGPEATTQLSGEVCLEPLLSAIYIEKR